VCGAKSTCSNQPGSFVCGCETGFGNCDTALGNGCEVALATSVTHCGGCGKACDGDLCTVGDTCSNSVCVPGSVTTCDDGLGCTADSCSPDKGCAHLVAADASSCSDGDACTVGDTCKVGACVAGPKANCDDNNACTADSCDKAKGCIHAADTSVPCDGTVSGDRCYKPVKTEATWQQAEDACVAWGGHLASVGSLAETYAVRDAALWTCQGQNYLIGLNDIAEEGKFAWNDGSSASYTYWNAGEPNDFNNNEDIVEATLDGKWNDSAADYKAACYVCERPYVKPTACDDGNVCTVDDACSGGTCKPGPANPCGDGDFCTTGTCDPTTGCKQALKPDGAVCGAGGTCGEGNCIRPGILRRVENYYNCQMGLDADGELSGKVGCTGGAVWAKTPMDANGYVADTTPINIPLPGKVIDFAGSTYQYCALLADGTVWCLANADLATQSAPSGDVAKMLPTQVQGLPGPASKVFLAISQDQYYRVACALVSGSVYCWGKVDILGGAAPVAVSSTAVKLQGLPANLVDFQFGRVFLSSSPLAGWALTASGEVYQWGKVGPSDNAVWPPVKRDTGGQAVKGFAGMTGVRPCGIAAGGKIVCWDPIDMKYPFWEAPALANGVVDVSVTFDLGFPKGCALLASGAVYCGGKVTAGETGDGTYDGADKSTPASRPMAKVPLPGDAVALGCTVGQSINKTHSAVLKDTKTFYWGQRMNLFTSLFPGEKHAVYPRGVVSVYNPPKGMKELIPLSSLGPVASGACAIDLNDIPQCWGTNPQLGVAGPAASGQTKLTALTAGTAAVAGLASATWMNDDTFGFFVGGGGVHCKVGLDGKAFCWGPSVTGVVQDNLGAAAAAVAVQRQQEYFWDNPAGCANGVFSVSFTRCYVMTNGSVLCAGGNNCGQLGIGNTNYQNPNQFFMPSGFDKGIVQLAMPVAALCALRADGKVLCAGRGGEGQMGNGSFSAQLNPGLVNNVSDAKAIAASAANVCAVIGDGTVSCWGAGSAKALGSTNYANSSSAQPVQAYDAQTMQTSQLTGATTIAAARSSFCALTPAGAWCWGRGIMDKNNWGAARLIPGTAGAAKIRGGSEGSESYSDNADTFCADSPKGTWSCWGFRSAEPARRRIADAPIEVTSP
jgi:hypothetical protein